MRIRLILLFSDMGRVELYDLLEWPEQMFPYAKAPTVALYAGKKMTHWGWPAEAHRAKFPGSFFVQRVKLHLIPPVEEAINAFDPCLAAPLPPAWMPSLLLRTICAA